MKFRTALLTLCVAACFAAPLAQALSSAASPSPSTLPPSDWAGIRAAHDTWRHRFEKSADGTHSATNPTQNWTTRFDGRGFLIEPAGQDWRWGLELDSYGVGTSRVTLTETASVAVSDNTLSYRWNSNLEEWFLNDARGIEQGWTFNERPEGSKNDRLRLDLAVRGGLKPMINAAGLDVSFTDLSGAALTYGGLKAWDSTGHDLTVRFVANGANQISIEVDDRNAVYPVTIDPVAEQARLKADNAESNDAFGWSVAISGDTVAVGARFEGGFENNFPSSGAVYIFVRSGTTWTQQAYLRAFNAGADDYFGTSVALSGDTLVVGATHEDGTAAGDAFNNNLPNSGAVYVYTRTGATWTIQSRIKAPNAGDGDLFGGTVAVSNDFIFVGATGEDSSSSDISMDNNDGLNDGAVYVYSFNGTIWTLHTYLKASTTDAGDTFGSALAVSGETLVVGARADGIKGRCAVFTYNGSTWNEQGILEASNAQPNDSFGAAVAISGDTIVVGAPNEDTDLSDAIASGEEDIGAAYVFVRNSGMWTEQAILKASNAERKDEFGTAVAVSGDVVAVGANYEDSDVNGSDSPGLSNSGAVYVFHRSGTAWTERRMRKGSASTLGAGLGQALAFDGNTIIAGAASEDNSGSAYIFTTEPEIAVEQPAATDLADGAGTTDFGSGTVGTTVETITFTIRNTGLADLTGLSVSISGSHAADFTSGTLGSTSLTPGASTTFTVTFAPDAAGARTAALHLASNDADENPFDIALSGTGVAVTTSAPEIVVQEPAGTNLVDGSASLAFGNTNTGTSSAKTITIRNTGTANLTGLAVTRSGTHATDFTLGSLGSTTLTPGASTTFTVTFAPGAAGARTAALQIASNDADENPFNIALGGTGVAAATAPEIVVEQPAGTSLVDGSASLAFGNTNTGSSSAKTITIRNTGTANLTGLAVTRSGTHATDFALGALDSTTLKPGASTTFTVTFTPGEKGARSATLQIASNDADENPFDLALSGTGLDSGKPEIVVQQGKGKKKNLKDNRSSRDFGKVKIGSASKPMVFTIKNTGEAKLAKLQVTFKGKQAKDFKLVKKPAKSLAPGKSTRFKVIYQPSAAKDSKTTMRIRNNDPNENPFRVKLGGEGGK